MGMDNSFYGSQMALRLYISKTPIGSLWLQMLCKGFLYIGILLQDGWAEIFVSFQHD